MLISRLAPTPSGYLHIGNILNFLITVAIIKQSSGTLWLRIDDGDQTRVREEYLQDIFECLKWLKIGYDFGPRDLQEHKSYFSQTQFFQAIQASLLSEKDLELFSCQCSRKSILQQSPDARYPGTCYHQKQLLFDSNHTIRVQTKDFLPKNYFLNKEVHQLGAELHDLILWKKDQSPSYHLLSLLHDQKIGVNTIIRGMDLLDSTAVQFALSQAMRLSFHENKFYHHPLISHADGSKISKSTNKAETKSLVDQFQSEAQFFENLSEHYGKKIHSTEEFIRNYEFGNWDELKVAVH